MPRVPRDGSVQVFARPTGELPSYAALCSGVIGPSTRVVYHVDAVQTEPTGRAQRWICLSCGFDSEAGEGET